MSANATTTASQSYEQLRPYLFAVAYRMTGSATDAEDLVQDAWMRYLDTGSPAVASLRAYLTTIISRLALDYLKSARVKREQYAGTWLPEPVLSSEVTDGPEIVVEQRETISLALLTLMEHLTPEQRVVYVLREGYGLSHDEIAVHIGKSAAACRQIFRRAQVRLEQTRAPALPSPTDHRLVESFLDAFSRGDAAGIARLLLDDARWVADGGPDRLANRRPVVGRDRISRGLAGLAGKVRPGMQLDTRILDINGTPAIAIFDHGKLERILALETTGDQIATVQVLINPEKLRHLAATLGTEPAWDSPYKMPRGQGSRRPRSGSPG